LLSTEAEAEADAEVEAEADAEVDAALLEWLFSSLLVPMLVGPCTNGGEGECP